tara:strand:+ start:492 stop:902 length:411 start_codon:yes stop_codon:yes gene_type:complete
MSSYTTVNKVDENGRICKYDNFATREEADARIAELHQIAGYEDAFVVDNDETAVDGLMCFQMPEFWSVDKVAKTVTLDRAAKDAEELASNIQKVQNNRRAAYIEESDSLFFEEQRGEVSAGTHAAKVEEIKARFPK